MKSSFKIAAALVLALGIGAQVSRAGLRPDDPPTPPPPPQVNPEPPIIDPPPPPPPVVPPPPCTCNSPEPGTMLLALSAVGIAGAYSRRKRKQAK
jgi:hypothetical protein